MPLFETLGGILKPGADVPFRTAKDLLHELEDRYTVDELNDNIERRYLYDTLKNRASYDLTNETKPGDYTEKLVKKFLGYTYPII